MKKITAIICTICLVLSIGVVAYAGEYQFENENNDTFNSASYVKSIDYSQSIVIGTVGDKDQEDWFRFYADKSGPSSFRLHYEDSMNADIDIYLYDKNGYLIMKGSPMTNTSTGKKSGSSICDYYIRKDNKYYIKVKYNSGYIKEPYRLILTISQQ